MKIEVLFSEVCNLSGDFQNVEYLRQSLPEAEFIFTSLTDTPYFAENRPDMVLMGTMTEAIQRRVIETLRPYRDRLEKLIDDGVVFLMTGNACEVFVKRIDYVTEKLSVDGLGLFDLTAKTDLFHRYNGKFWATLTASSWWASGPSSASCTEIIPAASSAKISGPSASTPRPIWKASAGRISSGPICRDPFCP